MSPASTVLGALASAPGRPLLPLDKDLHGGRLAQDSWGAGLRACQDGYFRFPTPSIFLLLTSVAALYLAKGTGFVSPLLPRPGSGPKRSLKTQLAPGKAGGGGRLQASAKSLLFDRALFGT